MKIIAVSVHGEYRGIQRGPRSVNLNRGQGIKYTYIFVSIITSRWTNASIVAILRITICRCGESRRTRVTNNNTYVTHKVHVRTFVTFVFLINCDVYEMHFCS